MPKRQPNDFEVTIGNLERENRNLMARIEELVKSRDGETQRRIETMMQRDAHARDNQRLEVVIDNLRQENVSLRRSTDHNDGYISRVKETDRHMYGEPGSSA